MTDWLEQAGIVLFAADRHRSVAFYRDVVGLPVLTETDYVTILRFGAAYLMIEPGGTAVAGGKSRANSAVTLRFNVADIDAAAQRLRQHGVAVSVEHFEWGSIGGFIDPDGNRCELRNHFDGVFAPRRD